MQLGLKEHVTSSEILKAVKMLMLILTLKIDSV
jgi:hypothetical protein